MFWYFWGPKISIFKSKFTRKQINGLGGERDMDWVLICCFQPLAGLEFDGKVIRFL
jgi:hypothetical protein